MAGMISVEGVHHITLNGADRASSIAFWQDVLGMPFIFEQPNLDRAEESHLYFDPGDGRLITVFCAEDRKPDARPVSTEAGSVHHLAFIVSAEVFAAASDRLKAAGIACFGPKDRGFMHSIYFRDPLGLLIELAHYIFTPPPGVSHAQVLAEAHKLRLAAGDRAIAVPHLEAAVAALRGAGS